MSLCHPSCRGRRIRCVIVAARHARDRGGHARQSTCLPKTDHYAGRTGSGAQCWELGSRPAPEGRVMSSRSQRGATGWRASGAGEAEEVGGTDPAQADPSRRALLRGAAGAGVAGVAASTLIGLPAAQALASTTRPAASAASRRRSADRPPATGQPASSAQSANSAASASDVVVHVRDARSGELDIFSGTSMTRLTDPALARRLMRAIG